MLGLGLPERSRGSHLRHDLPRPATGSVDLGATGFQTFRYVTFPVVRTAIVAGALLAFALSWDEIVVTYFTAGAQNTLPLLLFGFIRQGQNLPIVNAIALVVIVVSAIPVWVAQRLTSGSGGSGRGVEG